MEKTHYNPGDIVYTVEMKPGGWRLDVQICEVEDQYGSMVCVGFVTVRDSRIINGIPIDKFERTKPQRLPKGWFEREDTHDFYELTYDDSIHDRAKDIDIRDKAAIRKGLDEGFLVSGAPTYSIQTGIAKEGYTVYVERKIHERRSGTYSWFQIYDDYDSARKYINDHYAELERQSKLSDEEWSKEQIENTLGHYVKCYSIQPEEEQRIRDIVFNLDRIEDVEARIGDGVFQWKYCKHKKWNTV